ncbi:MAG: peroxide stress protein YaaA [Propionibacteriales bacterium]|nr:peroxide stress protein YaaA [Propionibacteriales bacterium]
MLILLPPSESKRAPRRRGKPVDLATFSFAELDAVRREVLVGLDAVSRNPDAVDRLGLSAGLADLVGANLDVLSAAARPAIEVYDGILYEALDWNSLSPGARRRGSTSVIVQSALWGPVRPRDRITGYRLAMGTRLPSGRTVVSTWKSTLGPVMSAAAGRGSIVDCRSGTYAAAWQPAGALADRAVAVRVFREEAGRRTVVSHLAKHTRGLVARWLLEADRAPRTVADVAAVVAEHVHCELGPGTLDVIEPA